jgi:hypothetical protein
MLRHMPAEFVEHRPQDVLPLAVHEAGRVVPGLHLRLARHVGPGMMAVGCEMQAVRFCVEEAGELGTKIKHDAFT